MYTTAGKENETEPGKLYICSSPSSLALYTHLRFCDTLNKRFNFIYDLPGDVFRPLCYHSTAFQATGTCVLKNLMAFR